MKRRAVRPLALLLAIVGAPAAAVGPIESSWPCRSESQGGDLVDQTCELPAGAAHYHYVAHFSGGHDDTKASLQPTLDGEPIACEEGSKTRLISEEGDVTLDCRFSTPPGDRAALFAVQLKWTCAQHERSTLLGR